MNFLRQDILYAVRQLRKSPGFAAAVVLTLALGIGANLTVFLILYGVILKPLPFPEPQQLVRVNRFYPDGTTVPAYSGTKALFLRRVSRTLESAAAYDYIPSHVNLLQGDQVVPLEALRATSDFFRVFRMEPKLGRGFTAADMVPNAPAVAVLSDSSWRQQFNADPNVLGRSITLGNKPYTVIGVANPAFRLDSKVDVWVPLQIIESATDQANNYNFVARLKPGVTREQAQDDLKRVLFQLKSTYPDLWDRQESVRVIDFHDSLTGPVRPALEMLMGAVGLVLIIVAANVLSLLLTRSIGRRISDSSPTSRESKLCADSNPVNSRIAVPALPMSRSCPAAARPRSPRPRTRTWEGAGRSIATPIARMASRLARQSSLARKPRTSLEPVASPDRRMARCEIDLSPGTASGPATREAGWAWIEIGRAHV